MVKSELTNLRLAFGVGAGCILWGAVGVKLAMNSSLPMSFFPAVTVMLTGIVILALIPRLRKRDRRRQEAINQANSSIPLVPEQPRPNASALPLPTIIALQFRLRALVLYLGAVLPMAMLVLVGLTVLGGVDGYAFFITHPRFFRCIHYCLRTHYFVASIDPHNG